MFRMLAHRTILLAALLVFCPAALYAQSITATISGQVLDTSGASVSGARVLAVNTETGDSKTVVTNENGEYVFAVLPVGLYRVETSVAGFKRFVRDGIQLTVNRNARVDFALQLGEVKDNVVVTGDAPLVDTREVQIGGLVDGRSITDLPLIGRNVYDLVALLPGVTDTRTTSVPDDTGNYIRVNGSRTRQSTFLLDGNFNNNLYRNTGNEAPNPDAVQEFRVITSNFSAEFGRSPGAVVNAVTKSGTNSMHGTLFEFLRNDKLNARNYFRPDVSMLRQNQFGGSLGGPIKHNKLFYFTSYQGLRVRSSEFHNTAFPPTDQERVGDFSSLAASRWPTDPLTKQVFPGGRIPASRLDPVAQNILKYVPAPNTADGRLQVTGSSSTSSDQALGKVDWVMNERHKLYGNIFLLKSPRKTPFNNATIPDWGAGSPSLKQYNVVANEDWMMSPALLNQFRSGLTRKFSISQPDFDKSWPDFGSHITLGSNMAKTPPLITVSGRWAASAPYLTHYTNQSFNASDTLHWMRGSHSIAMGSWVIANQYNEVGTWASPGIVSFDGGITKNALGDFLLGNAQTFRQNNGVDFHFSSWNWHSFIQDDWKVAPRLTLNLGLRYEVDMPFASVNDYIATFRFNQQSRIIPKAPIGLVYPGDQGITRGLLPTDRNNFAPRIGFAWDVLGHGMTAIRAGYGVFYASDFANTWTSAVGQPFLVDLTLYSTPSLVNAYANQPGGSPFPFKFDPNNPRYTFPITAVYMNENIRSPYVQHYSFTVEQQLRKDLVATAGYVGNTSRKMLTSRDANDPIYIPGESTTANVNSRRPYMPGTYAAISESTASDNAHYDSLQATVRKRFTHGFSVLASYTLGKSIDDASDDRFSPATMIMTDSFNRKYDRAVSDADVRHILVVSYLWDLPRTSRVGFAGKHVLSGWQFNGITRLRSGLPVNITSGVDTNLNGRGGDRPDLIGDPYLSSDRSRDERMARFFNTAAFRRPGTGLNGTAGRNLIHGPGAFKWDASLFRKFRTFERHELQFRAEAFSVLNHMNPGQPTGAQNSGNFGRILSGAGERVFQFGVKYLF